MSEKSDSFSQISLDMSAAMAKSDHGKVIFHEVADSYVTDADVECRYKLTSSVIPSKGDRVALFKLGWVDIYQAITHEWVELSEEVNYTNEMSILFKAQNLPKDDGEFYQFCYITHDGSVRGSSFPFKFRRPTDDDLVEVEDDDNDLMIIRSRTALIEDRLRAVAVKNLELSKEKTVLEEKLAAKERECSETENKLKVREADLTRLHQEIVIQTQRRDEEFNQMLQKLQDAQINSDKQKSDNESTLLQNEAYISELRGTIKVLTDENTGLGKKLAVENKEVVNLKKKLGETENRSKAFAQKSEQLSKELADQREAARRFQNQIQILENNVKDDKDLKAQLVRVEEERKHLELQLQDTGHMLAAMEKSKHLASEELRKSTESHDESKKQMLLEFEEYRAANTNLQEKFRQLEGDHKKELERNSNLEKEYRNLFATLHILQKNEEENSELKKQFVANETALKALIDDLTVRLKTGAVEYQAKYLECLRLQKKLTKLKQKYKVKVHDETKEDHQSKSDVDVSQSSGSATATEYQQLRKSSVSNEQVEFFELKLAEKDSIISSLDYEIKKLKAQVLEESNQIEKKNDRNVSSSSPAAHNFQDENEIKSKKSSFVTPETAQVEEQARTSSMMNCPYPYQQPTYPSTYPMPNNPFVCEANIYNSSSSSHESASQKKNSCSVTGVEYSGEIKRVQMETLPPPLQPKVTSDAKVAAVMAVTRSMDKVPEMVSRSGHVDNEMEGILISEGASAPHAECEEQSDQFTCPLCSLCFPRPYDFQAMQQHIDSHFTLECPMCSRCYESNEPTAFQNHVENHFKVDRKPQSPSCNPFSELTFD